MEKYNNNNEHEYDPYIISDDGKLVIDADWWQQSLTPKMQRQIESRTAFELGTVKVPHVSYPYTSAELGIVYRAYLEGFDYQHWYTADIPNGPRNVVMLPVSPAAKRELSDRKPGDGVLELRQSLERVCSAGVEYFVRLSGTSGKNEKPVRPFKHADDIIKHLMSVELFRAREFDRDKETCVVLIPWNDTIDPRCEFRIFVVNGKLTAASPQRYWELHQHSSEELEAFETAFANIAFIGKVPYNTFVADVYVDVATSTCHLIELNPFGAHCGAGASFFNWIDDHDILYGLAPPEMRYLSAINY